MNGGMAPIRLKPLFSRLVRPKAPYNFDLTTYIPANPRNQSAAYYRSFSRFFSLTISSRWTRQSPQRVTSTPW